MSWNDRRWNRLVFLALGAFVFACSDGGSGCDLGCGGGDGESGPAYVFEGDSDEHVVMQGAQIHLTQDGLDRISENLDGLVGSFLGEEGLSFCLEPTDITVTELCGDRTCDDGTPGCQLSVELGDVRIIPERTTDPSDDRIKVEIDLILDEQLYTNGLIECEIGLGDGSPVPVALSAYLTVDGGEWERVHADLPIEELEFSLEDIAIDFSGGFLGSCNLVELILPIVTPLLGDLIAGPIEDAIGPALCTSCTTGADCPVGSSCNGESCIVDGTEECVPIDLGVEMEFALGEMLADFAPGLEADLGILAYAANYADAMGPPGSGLAYEGIDIGAQLGFFAPSNPCVPYYPPPATPRVAKSPALHGDLTPGGDAFGVGIGLARSALNLAGWAAYRSGALCISVGSDTISQVSTGTFAILLPSLSDLVDGANRPMYLELRPQRPPTFDLGLGTTNEDGSIDDPLLTLNLNELDIDFYVYAEDRYVRMLTLSGDIVVPLSLDVNDANQIVILLGDLTEAVSGLSPSNGELLSARDEGAVATVLPTLIGGLLPTLLGDLEPIDIPEIADGISIVIPPGGITSVDGGQMLAIFADLAFGAPEAKAGALSPEIASMHVTRAPLDEVRAMLDASAAGTGELDLDLLIPTVELTMDTFDPSGETTEFDYSYRINGGIWTQWRTGNVLTVRDVAMGLSGDYDIDVQVRVAGTPHTSSSVYASTTVRVDYVPPTIDVRADEQTLVVSVEDLHSPEDVDARYRLDGGAWVRLPESGSLVIDAAPGAVEIEVEAEDAFGNTASAKSSFSFTSPVASERNGSPIPSAPVSADPARGGCASTSGTGGGAALLIGLLGLIGLRRRRSVVLTGVAVLAMSLAACGDDDKGSGSDDVRCDPECADGESCVEGVCVAEAECATDDECGDGELCVEGECVADTSCETDDDCAEGEVCEEGACVEPTGCESDDDCGDGQYCDGDVCTDYECVQDSDCGGCGADEDPICVDNACACEEPCPQGCGDGTACCAANDECIALEATCEPATCDVGFGVVPVGDPTFDAATCEVTVECECAELPPLPLGNTGVYLDLGISQAAGVSAVAGYNSTYGDLMVGIVGSDDTIDWSYVAGLPDGGSVTGSLNGPRGGIADGGDNVGEYPSIAVGDDGALHVAFYASSGEFRRSLVYGYGAVSGDGYEWTFVQADATDSAGHYTDIELNAEGLPVIAYAVPAFRTEAGEFQSQVRVVAADSAAPTAAENWGEPAVIVRSVSDLPCGASCVGRQECRTDLNLCQAPERASFCEEDCGDGECFENEDGSRSCAPTAASPEGIPVLFEGIGVFLDMEFLPEGRIGFAFYDRPNGNLVSAITDATTFAEVAGEIIDGETIDPDTSERVDTGDAGWFPDLFVASDGGIHISYAEAGTGALRIADLNAGATIPVDDGVRCYEFDTDSGECSQPLRLRVGYDSAIAEDETGLYLVYQDATWLEILESPLGEFGWDLPGTVARGGDPYTGAYGFYIGHGVGADGRFAVSYRINQRSEPPTRDVAVIPR